MNKVLTILTAFLLLAPLVACRRSDPIATTYGFGYVKGDSIFSDGNIEYVVTSSTCGDGWRSLDRVYFECRVGSSTSTRKYEAVLMDFEEMILKEPVDSDDPAAETLGDDAVCFAECIISGAGRNTFLNFFEVYFVKKGSDTEHDLNFVFNKEKSAESDTLFFTLRHNGHGETYDNPDIPMEDLDMAETSCSMRIGDYIRDGAEGIKFAIEFDWHIFDFDSDSYERRTEHFLKAGKIDFQPKSITNDF